VADKNVQSEMLECQYIAAQTYNTVQQNRPFSTPKTIAFVSETPIFAVQECHFWRAKQ